MTLALLAAVGVAAAARPAAHPGLDLPEVRGNIVIDGVLDDDGWRDVPPVTDFVRYLPTPGGAHGSTTSVRVAQDDKHLYIGVKVSGGAPPVARIAPREDINNDDQIGIYIDPFFDGRGGYIFYFNAHGIQQDARFAFGSWYGAWNTVVYAEGTVLDDGYVLEVAIPYRSLRFPRTGGRSGETTQTWGLMVTRKIPNEGVKLSWPPLQPRHPQMFAQAAPVRGVRPPSTGTGIEVMPVIAANHQLAREEPGAPLEWTARDQSWTDSVRPGVDARAALTPDLGLAATINPDFSQVEGDIQQIDLNQRFAFYYPEQRPFFLTGLEAFTDTTDTLYTRSVADPLYGVKLSGRTGKVGVGVLHALDHTPVPSIHELGTPGFSEDELTDRIAATTFARTRLDVVDKGYVGLSVADKRVLQAPPALGPTDGSPAPPSTGGVHNIAVVDALVPFGETWTTSAWVAGSLTSSDEESIDGVWEGLRVRRSPSLGTGGGVAISDRSEGFRNEVGFLPQSAITTLSADVFHRVSVGDGTTVLQPKVFANGFRERDGDAQSSVGLEQSAEVAGNHYPGVWGEVRSYVQDGVELTGFTTQAYYSGRLTDWLQMSGSGQAARVFDFDRLDGALDYRANSSATVRPTSRLRFDVFYTRQWFNPAEDPLEQADRVYARANYQLSREWGLRLVGASASPTNPDDPRSVFSSVLLTWLKTPGTEAYVGGTWSTLADPAELQQQTVFVKFSKLFRL